MKLEENIVVKENEWKELQNLYEGQSAFFRLYSENRGSDDCEYYRFYENDICKMEVLIRYIYYDKSNAIQKIKQVFKGRQNGMLEILDGPILYCENAEYKKWIDCFWNFVLQKKKEKRIHSLRIERTKLPIAIIEDMKSELEKKGLVVRKWATLVVDLTQEENVLRSNLKHSARLGINKGKRCGLYVDEISDYDTFVTEFVPNLALFKEVNEEVIRGNKILNWKAAQETGCKKYFLVKQNDLILGTICLGVFANEVIIEDFAYNKSICMDLKLPASDFMIWELMLRMKAEGHKNFNLAGVNPEPKSKKEKGIRNFKEKWRGKYIEYYDFYYEPIRFIFLKKIYRLYVDNK